MRMSSSERILEKKRKEKEKEKNQNMFSTELFQTLVDHSKVSKILTAFKKCW